MTLTTPYQASFYVGDGETKTFPFVFEEVSDNFVKVIVSHIDGTTSIPTYTVDLDLKQVVFGDETPAPTADDIVCIYRETPTIQDTPFKTLEGYNAKALENILSKIVAMIQEIKSNYFSTQVLQGDPWQLDLLKSADNGATVNIDYVAKKLVKGLYFQISNGNLQVSADGNSYITMPKSADIVEFKQTAITLPDLSVVYKLQYRIGNEWFDAAESIAEATAEEAKQIAEDAKDIAQDASDAVSAHITDTNNPHSVTVAQIGALPDTTKYGATLSLTIDSTTYVVTAQLKDQDGNNLGTAQTIDLPLESVVVSGAYDSVTKEVVLTLQGGSTIRFSVADLVSGLQTEITALNMLDADLVDDTSTTHKFVTTTEKSTWNGKQDAISDLATIRSGASAGATAVQPGDLATVATSGSYNDLSNKPTIPTTLAGLTGDVSISSPSGGEHLVYDAVAGKWKNTPSAATVSWGGVTGTLSDQTDLQNALDGKANKDLDNLSSDGEERVFQPGIVLPFAGSTAPSGWLRCDGAAVSRTTYAKLFAVIGTTYGAGDGSTTFNLPNLQDRIPWYGGISVGATINGGLPDIQAQLTITNGASVLNLDGFYCYNALALASTTRSTVHYSTYTNPAANGHDTLDFHASRVASAYGRYSNSKVIPEGLQMYWCIKY